jgi:hypothetical protein
MTEIRCAEAETPVIGGGQQMLGPRFRGSTPGSP